MKRYIGFVALFLLGSVLLAEQSKFPDSIRLPDDPGKRAEVLACIAHSIRPQVPDTPEMHRRLAVANAAAARANADGKARVIVDTLVANNAQFGYRLPPFRFAITNEPTINASADVRSNLVELPREIIDFFINASGENSGELAYIIAHELGHLWDPDRNCRAHGRRDAALQRECEANADHYAIQYMMGAGYSPFDAAAAIGRFMMLSRDNTTVLGIIFERFRSDHPVDLDRIARMRDAAVQVCIDRPDICTRFKPVLIQ